MTLNDDRDNGLDTMTDRSVPVGTESELSAAALRDSEVAEDRGIQIA